MGRIKGEKVQGEGETPRGRGVARHKPRSRKKFSNPWGGIGGIEEKRKKDVMHPWRHPGRCIVIVRGPDKRPLHTLPGKRMIAWILEREEEVGARPRTHRGKRSG